MRFSISSLLFSTLFHKKAFLLFYLLTQFFFCWHISHVFSRKKLLATIKDGIFRHHFVSLGTEQYAYCRIVTLVFYKIIIHPHIHIQLPYVSVCQRMCFQFKQHVTLELDVIEHKINIKISGIR